ncbi:MAG: hypothetical protein IT182_02085 [Acidobacteria bacterium]|nr:hypothetical protein [Acidobacteriota bacterium]
MNDVQVNEPTRVALARISAIVAPHQKTLTDADLAGPVACVVAALEAGDRARPTLADEAIDLLHRRLNAPDLAANYLAQVLGETIAVEARHAARSRG